MRTQQRSPRHGCAVRQPFARRAVAAVVVGLLLGHSNPAWAGNVLRRPAAAGGAAAADAAEIAAAAAQAAAAQAAAARQAQSPLHRALDAIRAFQAAQAAARAAAQAASTAGDPPDGLVVGGLDPAPGATPGSAAWIGANLPTAQQTDAGRIDVVVQQTAPKAILTWNTFNVGKGTDLRFDQSQGGDDARSWIVLNRVEDPAMRPSRILGGIKADGQVYVINRNGVVFGGTSQVDVGSLLVSTLDFQGADLAQRNQTFLNGILGGTGPTFAFDATRPATDTPQIVVEPGASLNVAPYGQVLLLGVPGAGGIPAVVNQGSIEAPDGQVLLAAGREIYLLASADNRRLLASVNYSGGTVENAGIISAPRGNITMVGATVAQRGLLTATSSGDAEGSIYLGDCSAPGEACYWYEHALPAPPTDRIATTEVLFADGSVTQILPDESGGKIVGVSHVGSQLEAHADRISVLGRSTLYAPSGSIVLAARTNTADRGSLEGPDPAHPLVAVVDDTRVYVGEGATIDVSGLTDVQVDMERNTIEAQLRANELRDDPLLRNGPLRGHTVYFDARRGVNPGVADLSGYYDLVGRSIDELMTTGGKVTLSANEVITRQGSVIDLSGGSVRYLDGYVKSSVLIDATGRRVRIEDATPGVSYVGIDGDRVVTHARWGLSETYSSPLSPVRGQFEQGYVQGSAAGSLTVSTIETSADFLAGERDNGFSHDPGRWSSPHPNPVATGAFRIFDGDVRADVVVGPKQIELSTGSTDPTKSWREQPKGASLSISQSGELSVEDLSGPQLGANFDFRTAFAADDARRYQTLLPARWLNGVFTSVDIRGGYTDNGYFNSPATLNLAHEGQLTIARGVSVRLGDGGSFSFTGSHARIDGDIVAPGGTVRLTATDLPFDKDLAQTARDGDLPGIEVGGIIDVAGRWTDLGQGSGTAHALNGGSIALTGTSVVLAPGSLLDVSGGGRLDPTSGKVTSGKGGSLAITLSDAIRPAGLLLVPKEDLHLELSGDLAGYALGRGGSFSLDAGSLDVVLGGTATGSALAWAPDDLTRGGFASYRIAGATVTVQGGTQLAPSTEGWALTVAPRAIQDGQRLSDVTERRSSTSLPESLRTPMSLELAARGALEVETGARIDLDAGSSVSLSGATTRVDGTIHAAGGDITVAGTRVDLGANARIEAPGYTTSTPDGATVRRSVQDAGTVTIRGTISLDPASMIDVHGVSGEADLPSGAGLPAGDARYVAVPVDGNAGAVTIDAAAGSSLTGSWLLAAGGPRGAGGDLRIYGNGQRIVVHDGAATASTNDVQLDAGSVDRSGADALLLSVFPQLVSASVGYTRGAAIVFDGSVDLHTARSLTLFSPLLTTAPGQGNATVTLSSGYVLLHGGADGSLTSQASGATGSSFAVTADLIDVQNVLCIGCTTAGSGALGFDHVTLTSRGDIRLSDPDSAPRGASGFLVPGDLLLRSAQVYVASRNRDSVSAGSNLERPDADPGFLVRSYASIDVEGNGQPTTAPLSYGERLTLRAPEITQGGVLRAPQGQIRLEARDRDDVATGTVTLTAGSLTSVSLDGATVPFGPVAAGGIFQGYDDPGQAPSKSIRLDAPNVVVHGAGARGAAAVIDVQGGGDLLGYSFVAGNGGSTDLLSRPNTYAILPSLGSAPAPLGGTRGLTDPSLRVGDTVTLRGVPGLADGTYTLLPAHYALLPGGFVVQPLGATFASAPGTFTRADGAVVAAGTSRIGGTPDQSWRQFVVMPQSVAGQYSEILGYSFNAFATARAGDVGVPVRTASDAGTVVLAATDGAVLEGVGRFGAADGVVGNFDVAAPRIAVVPDGGAAPGPGYLTLETGALSNFGAGSLLLGGTRTATAAGTSVTVTASDVVIDTGAAGLVGTEILAAATHSITITDGSVLRASGTVQRDESALRLGADGAFVRVSTGGRVAIARDAGGTGSGVLTLGNAALSATGSLALDAADTVTIASAASLAAPQVDLGSRYLNLGDAPAGTSGTVLGTALVTQLASGSDLLLRGHDAVRVFGGLALGGPGSSGAHTSITLDTPLLQGYAAGATTTISAGTLALRNSGPGPSGAGDAGAGTLALDVDVLQLGPGDVRVAGYGAISGRASVVEAHGTGSLSFDGDLALATAQLREASSGNSAIRIGGSLDLRTDSSAFTPADAAGVGGRLSLQARSLSLDTTVNLPSGSFEATATGGALTLGAHARIDVRGTAVTFQDQVRSAPGGSIRLAASAADPSAGTVDVQAGAILDVSGNANGGDAGSIAISASGSAGIAGQLLGTARGPGRGGSFSLDAASVGDFAALNGGLDAGGLDAVREIRIRGPGEDLQLAAGQRLRAHEVLLQSDAGHVIVNGSIDASGDAVSPGGGTVQLIGGSGVAVGGSIDARAYAGELPADAFTPSSGKVELVASGGRVSIQPGSIIDVTGREGAAGGRVVVRAPRQGADVAVDALGGSILGAREISVQGSATTSTTTVDAPLVATTLADAASWLAGASAIRDRLVASSPGLAGVVHVGAGIELTSVGDLTIAAPIDLHTLGGPGYLALRAGGDLLIRASVSDGFSSADRTATLSSGQSSDLALEAERDVWLAPDALVRTGTGDISVRAGRDLSLASSTSVLYTAGRSTPTPSTFLGAPAQQRLGEFATDGGDLDLRAGRDILAPMPSQTTSAWLFRYGAANWNGNVASSTVRQQTSWSVVYSNFEQGVGALGGGDVRVAAGRDVVKLQVALPTTGFMVAQPGSTADAQRDVVVRGGGDLNLSAGRDLVGGLFVLGRGQADVRAGGSVRASDDPNDLRLLRGAQTGALASSPRSVAPLFGLMDATASVTAGSSIDVEGVFDPMRQGQIDQNLSPSKAGSAFWGYTDRTRFDATAVAGAVTYESDPWASVDLSLGAPTTYRVTMTGGEGTLNSMFSRAPPTLRLTSLESGVSVRDRFGGSTLTMAPADTGTLELLGAQDVTIALRTLTVEDVAPEYRRGAVVPFATQANQTVDGGNPLSSLVTNSLRGSTPIHAGDPEPARIVSLDGSVCAYSSGACVLDATSQPTLIVLPKPIDVFAGKDVFEGRYQPQHNAPDALTTIEAGRDVYEVALQVGGGGAAAITAGRDVVEDLTALNQVANPRGGLVRSLGNQSNPALAPGKATDVYVLAGAAGGVDYAGFAAVYLDPDNHAGVPRTYLPELAQYMSTLGYAPMSPTELVAAFAALPSARREVFLTQVYFKELQQTGIDYNDASSPRYHSYDRGFRAVSTLFPGEAPASPAASKGNVILNAKPLETQSDGSITVLAPYGRVAVGTEAGTATDNGKPGKDGIVTRRGGDIRIMADGNIDLYTSRVFTMQGGDITMWTSNGSITAGSGAKTTVLYVPLTYNMSSDGVVAVDVFGIQTGAGIGVLDALQNASDRPPSRLDLIAPKGEVNAGDAGIRVVGDLNIAAAVVVGIENIQVSGASSGVPAVSVPNVGAIAAATQVAQAAAQEGAAPEGAKAASRSAAADLPSIITVEVLGYEARASDAATDEDDARRNRKR